MTCGWRWLPQPTNRCSAWFGSIAENEPCEPVSFIPAADIELPAWARRPNVQTFTPAHRATGQAVVVGTIDKLGSARNPRRRDTPADREIYALIMDESFQANAGPLLRHR